MRIKITGYNIICNLGNDITEAYANAADGVSSRFEVRDDIIKSKKVRIGTVNAQLPEIKNRDYDLRCNRLLLKCFEKIDVDGLIKKYGKNKIGIVTATTNTGVAEYEITRNIEHTKISNPASFIKEHFGLENYFTSVSTACSSGIKAFSVGIELLKSGFSDAVIIAGTDGISKVPIFGFDSLEILTDKPSNPFSKNRCGINIGEGAGIFVLEKDVENGITVLETGETTDSYHPTTPEPAGTESARAIEIALEKSGLMPEQIDYINLHGTGTYANDLMEGNAIYKIFENKVPASSTKPLTGHCLGAAASIEIGLCLKLLESENPTLFPHVYDKEYDEEIKPINLVGANVKKKVKRVLCTSFGFGGTNAAIILGGNDAEL